MSSVNENNASTQNHNYRKGGDKVTSRGDAKRSAFGDLTNAECKKQKTGLPAPLRASGHINLRKPTTRSGSVTSTGIPLVTKDVPINKTSKTVTKVTKNNVLGQHILRVKKPGVAQNVVKPTLKLPAEKEVPSRSRVQVNIPPPLNIQQNVIKQTNSTNTIKLSALNINQDHDKGSAIKVFNKKEPVKNDFECAGDPNSLQSSGRSTDENGSGSLYMSALENASDESGPSKPKKIRYEFNVVGIPEYDEELLGDPHQMSLYATEIFHYLKCREEEVLVRNYMEDQKDLNSTMRALLIDWMVEVQENFELNHETLHWAIRYVDIYLSKTIISKEKLQLVGATALYIACKFDEPIVPMMSDFVHICDNAYNTLQFRNMEPDMLRVLKFNLGIPIAYSFLRRYARCIKIPMSLLTLARYILEVSRLDYKTVTLRESKQAAAALYLACKMTKHTTWNETLESCSGYKVEDFKDIVILFNNALHTERKDTVIIDNKYSNEVFFEVAKTPRLSNGKLGLPNID